MHTKRHPKPPWEHAPPLSIYFSKLTAYNRGFNKLLVYGKEERNRMDSPFFYIPLDSELESLISPTALDMCGQTISLRESLQFSGTPMLDTIDPTSIPSGTQLGASTILTELIAETSEGLLADLSSFSRSDLDCNTPSSPFYLRQWSPSESYDNPAPAPIYPNEEDSVESNSDNPNSDDAPSTKTRRSYKRNLASARKQTHNMIEKRYRTNLNDKISTLRDNIPSLKVISSAENADKPKKRRVGMTEDLHRSVPTNNITKATIISKATEYISHLEKCNKELGEAIGVYKSNFEPPGEN
ncbi:hypothetical protein F5884DRAFT_903049 [Xylogone sp. PMI_703]|nr:hypothetical protein F5884DRAFT_903049 [Xylogone sp. PMI_703]